MTNRLVTTALLLAMFGVTPLAVFAASAPSVGRMAPDFTLMSQEGTPISLKDYRGKWVVLYFYPKDFSSGCTVEAHNFQRDQAQYQKKNSVVLGVSVDSADSHKQFCTKQGLNFKLLADTDHKVSSAYGSLTNLGLMKFASRHTFIINPEGKVAKVFTEVNPNKHSDEVLAALQELQRQSRPQDNAHLPRRWQGRPWREELAARVWSRPHQRRFSTPVYGFANSGSRLPFNYCSPSCRT